MSRIHFEAEQGALAKFYLTRYIYAPKDEQQRILDAHALHCAVVHVPREKGEVLLRMRHLCGRPGMKSFFERIKS